MSKSPKSTGNVAQSDDVLAWYQRLDFKISLGFLLLLISLVAAAIFVIQTLVRSHLEDERLLLAERTGNHTVTALQQQLEFAEALTGTLANTGEVLRGRANEVRKLLPAMIDYEGYQSIIAGGGIWPEPYSFDKKVDRRSFFWGRDADGKLVYFDDYNDPKSSGYHSEEWYVPARFMPPGRCYWSRSYVDPFSLEPMVTCTAAMRSDASFIGVATVDIKLSGVTGYLKRLNDKQAGYTYAVDRNGRFVSFPSDSVARPNSGDPGGGPGEYLTVEQAAQLSPQLKPIARVISGMRDRIVQKLVDSGDYDATLVSQISDASYAVSRNEAEMIIATLFDPLAAMTNKSHLLERFTVDDDVLLNEPALVSVFHIPESYWYLVQVEPVSAGAGVAAAITRQSTMALLGAVALVLLPAFLLLRMGVIRPLQELTSQFRSLKYEESAFDVLLDSSAQNEIGLLAHWYNDRTIQLREMVERVTASDSKLAMEGADKRNLERALRQERDRANAVFRFVTDGVIVADRAGAVVTINDSASTMTAWNVKEAVGKDIGSVLRLFDSASQQLLSIGELVEATSKVSGGRGTEVILVDRAGTEIVVRAHAARVLDDKREPDGTVFTLHMPGLASDAGDGLSDTVSEHGADELTGLLGRRAFDRRFRELLQHARTELAEHALLFMEIDDFKSMNDTHGNEVGNEILKQFATELRLASGNLADLYRVRGTQFAVLMRDAAETKARQVAENIRTDIDRWQAVVDGVDGPIDVTISVGIMPLTADTGGPIETIRLAEATCRDHSERDRNVVNVYSAGKVRGVDIGAELAWIDKLKQGVQDNRLHLTSRPMAGLSGAVAKQQSFELILQYEDEEGFWVKQDAFMPIARQYNHAATIDRWAVERIADYLGARDEVHSRVDCCLLSMSGGVLGDPELPSLLSRVIESSGIQADKICLQFGEESVKARLPSMQQLSDAAESIGFRIVLSRFSGSKAGFELLEGFNISMASISGRIIGSEDMSVEDLVELTNRIRAADAKCIAEGINSATQLEKVVKSGFDYALGDAIGCPDPILFRSEA